MQVYILVESEDYEKDQVIACYSTVKKAIARKEKMNKQMDKFKRVMVETNYESDMKQPFYGELLIKVHRIY